MKIFEKLKALFGKKSTMKTPEVDQITERLIDVSTKLLVRFEESSIIGTKPSIKEIKSKSTKKSIVKEEGLQGYQDIQGVRAKSETPKVIKKATVKKPRSKS